MRNKPSIIIAGLARECGHSLPVLLRSMVALGSRFHDWQYVFIENDSFDNTRRILGDFHNEHGNGIVKYYRKLDRKHNKRTARLALLRNEILDLAYSISADLENTFLILMDLDGANQNIDIDRIVQIVSDTQSDWSAVFANQSENYYDLWAFRHPDLCPTDVLKEVRERPDTMSREEASQKFVEPRRRKIPADSGLIPVQSAFGGLGIYKLSKTVGSRYVGLDIDGEEVCEHVAFHLSMGKLNHALYIDSALINGTGKEEHNVPVSRFQRRLRKLTRYLP